jgi:hypothetical protein
MRIKLIIKDKEYREAFSAALSRYGQDLLIETARNIDMDGNTLFVTDHSIRTGLNEQAYRGIIKLENEPQYAGNEWKWPYHSFKYADILSIISEISLCYSKLTGIPAVPGTIADMIFFFSDSEGDDSAALVKRFAGDLTYHTGKRVLVLPLMPFNHYGSPDERDFSSFSRMLYYNSIGRSYDHLAFFYTDSYDISYLRLPVGRNPIEHLDQGGVKDMITQIAKAGFDSVVLDAGASINARNLALSEQATRVYGLFEHGSGDGLKDFFRDDHKPDLMIDLRNGYEDTKVILADEIQKLTGGIT